MNRSPNGSEWTLPPIMDIFKAEFIVPFSLYFSLFRVASLLVKRYMWKEFIGFKQYRLQNLTICLLHSVISGSWSLIFAIMNRDIMMNDIMHWYQPFAIQLPILSMAYFVHDGIDMMKHEWSRWTIELLFHHFATCTALICGVLPKKFLLADYWALLMEGNSIFLHSRTIMQISGYSIRNPLLYRVVVYSNIASFILLRFVAQTFLMCWMMNHMFVMHPFYAFIGSVGQAVFVVINTMLLFRLIAADFLGEKWQSKAAIGRDGNSNSSSINGYHKISDIKKEE